MHGASSFLQNETGRVVFAGRGKGTDGQRASVAERGGDFVGERKAEEVDIFVRPEILQRTATVLCAALTLAGLLLPRANQ
jgi:hypothetical protein